MGDEQFIILPKPMVPGKTKFGTFRTIEKDAKINSKRYFGENTQYKGTLYLNNKTGGIVENVYVTDQDTHFSIFSGHLYGNHSRIEINISNLGKVEYNGKEMISDDYDVKMNYLKVTYRDSDGNYHTQKAEDKNGNGIVDENEIENID